MASPDLTPLPLVALAAVVAEKLRESFWTRHLTWAALAAAYAALPAAARADAAELGALIDAAAALDRRPDRYAGHGDTLDVDALPVLRR